MAESSSTQFVILSKEINSRTQRRFDCGPQHTRDIWIYTFRPEPINVSNTLRAFKCLSNKCKSITSNVNTFSPVFRHAVLNNMSLEVRLICAESPCHGNLQSLLRPSDICRSYPASQQLSHQVPSIQAPVPSQVHRRLPTEALAFLDYDSNGIVFLSEKTVNFVALNLYFSSISGQKLLDMKIRHEKQCWTRGFPEHVTRFLPLRCVPILCICKSFGISLLNLVSTMPTNCLFHCISCHGSRPSGFTDLQQDVCRDSERIRPSRSGNSGEGKGCDDSHETDRTIPDFTNQRQTDERNLRDLPLEPPESMRTDFAKGLEGWTRTYNLAVQYMRLRKFDEGILHFTRCLETTDRLFKADQIYIADAHKGLGLAYAIKGETREAERHLQQSLNLKMRYLGSADSRLINDFEVLGEICFRRSDFKEALLHLKRAFSIAKRIWGLQHPKSSQLFESIARTCHAMGMYPEALAAYKSACQIRQQLFGEHALSTADVINNMAITYQSLFEYEKALRLLESALRVYEIQLGKSDMRIAYVVNNMGVIYFQQHNLTKAKEHFERALEIKQWLFGKNHINTADALYNLGITYQKMGHFLKALLSFTAVLRIAGRFDWHCRVHADDMDTTFGSPLVSPDQRRVASQYFEKTRQILVANNYLKVTKAKVLLKWLSFENRRVIKWRIKYNSNGTKRHSSHQKSKEAITSRNRQLQKAKTGKNN